MTRRQLLHRLFIAAGFIFLRPLPATSGFMTGWGAARPELIIKVLFYYIRWTLSFLGRGDFADQKWDLQWLQQKREIIGSSLASNRYNVFVCHKD